MLGSRCPTGHPGNRVINDKCSKGSALLCRRRIGFPTKPVEIPWIQACLVRILNQASRKYDVPGPRGLVVEGTQSSYTELSCWLDVVHDVVDGYPVSWIFAGRSGASWSWTLVSDDWRLVGNRSELVSGSLGCLSDTRLFWVYRQRSDTMPQSRGVDGGPVQHPYCFVATSGGDQSHIV